MVRRLKVRAYPVFGEWREVDQGSRSKSKRARFQPSEKRARHLPFPHPSRKKERLGFYDSYRRRRAGCASAVPAAPCEGTLICRPRSNCVSAAMPLSFATSSTEALYRAAIFAIVSPASALTVRRLLPVGAGVFPRWRSTIEVARTLPAGTTSLPPVFRSTPLFHC